MFSGLQTMPRTDADLAAQALIEEGSFRFPFFSASDAVTLGLSLRKRFRLSSRHNKGKGLVISVQTIAGHTLFSCTVGDLGHVSGVGDVSLDSWACLEDIMNVVKQTGHSSFYVEKGMSALGKTAKQMGMQNESRVSGGAFPIWLENAHCCPIAVIACYSGSSNDDHNLTVTTIKDFLRKLSREATTDRHTETPAQSVMTTSSILPTIPRHHEYGSVSHTSEPGIPESEYRGGSEYSRGASPYEQMMHRGEHDDHLDDHSTER